MPMESTTNLNYEMLKPENIQKFILPYYGLSNAQISQIKFKDTAKQRAVYKIETLNNNFCLKKIYFDKKDLLFVYSAIEWLYRYEINVPRILPTLTGNKFVKKNNMLFILTQWIDGDRCSYDIKENVIKSCDTLSMMHKAGISFSPITGSLLRTGYENINTSISKHFEDLLKCSNAAFNYKDKFSRIFLNSFEQNILLAKRALEISFPIDKRNLRTSLCHGDYVNKNILFDKKGNVFIIDFDKCKMDYCTHDLSYFLRRLMKRENTRWEPKLAIDVLETYNSNLTLSLDEYRYIIAYLSFPQKYWKISKDYYNNINRCNKHSFQVLLSHSIEKEEGQIECINMLSAYIKGKFNISI